MLTVGQIKNTIREALASIGYTHECTTRKVYHAWNISAMYTQDEKIALREAKDFALGWNCECHCCNVCEAKELLVS